MPRKRPRGKKGLQKIGPGKKGSGKRMIHRAGGTRRDLSTWRSLSRSTRKRIKSNARRAGSNYDIRRTMRKIRRARRS